MNLYKAKRHRKGIGLCIQQHGYIAYFLINIGAITITSRHGIRLRSIQGTILLIWEMACHEPLQHNRNHGEANR